MATVAVLSLVALVASAVGGNIPTLRIPLGVSHIAVAVAVVLAVWQR